MDTPVFQALDEWCRLESAHHSIKAEKGAEPAEPALFALRAKTAEILEMRVQTRDDALALLRFCATCLEQGNAHGHLAVIAIRNAVNILS